jgi:predicted AAA+ superfamily ATPase
MDSYHEDIVEEWLSEHDLPARAEATRKVLETAEKVVPIIESFIRGGPRQTGKTTAAEFIKAVRERRVNDES